MRDGVFQVLATAGDTQLGGDDIDRGLAEWIWTKHHGAGVEELPLRTGKCALLSAAAEEAKKKFPKYGTFGPPIYAATHVMDEAIASACKNGTPSRSSVLAAVKATDEPTSILGQPIKFDSHGDLVGGKFFLFKINSAGKYQLIPSS